MRALGLALLLTGCAHAPPAPSGMLKAPDLPDRLYCVAYDEAARCTVYRSAQPSAAEFAGLVSHFGIRSVIKLNDLLPFDGGDDVVPDGVLVMRERWLPAGPVSHEQVAEALEDLDAAPKPVLVHCTRGIDRTGLLVALYRIEHGSAPFAAWMEWLAFGHIDSLEFRLLRDAFERETGWSP